MAAEDETRKIQATAGEAEQAAKRADQAAEDTLAAYNIADDRRREAEHEAIHTHDREVHDAARRAKEDASKAHTALKVVRASARVARQQAEIAGTAVRYGSSGEAERASNEAKEAAAHALECARVAQACADDSVEVEQAAERRMLESPILERISSRELEEELAESRPALYLAEFEDAESCMKAAERVRDAGYQHWDVHTPYPVHGMESAMGLRPTKLGIPSFIVAMIGLISAVLMMQYMNNWDYPIIVGGKPPDSFPWMVPIMFELTVLFTGIGTLLILLHMTRLPRHHHPIFNSARFATASDNRFFISVEAGDPSFDVEQTREMLESLEPSHVELVEERTP